MELILSDQTVTVNGKTIPKVYGGFGNNQPTILAKQIAELHEYKLKEINQLVNNNIAWFDEGIDFIDIKSVVIQNDHGVKHCLLKFYTQEGLNRSVYIYLFSQQGYAMLCKLLKSDLAKQIYKQMVRDYFRMVENQQSLNPIIVQTAKTAKELAQIMGFEGNQATLFVNRIVKERHGIDLLEIGGQTALISADQEPDYNATTLGKSFLDGISGRKINQLLAKAGLIYSYRDNKNRIQWDATEKGKPYVIWKDTGKKHSNGTPVKQLLYKQSIVDVLKKSGV